MSKVSTARTRDNQLAAWRHPGGKLRRLGPESLTDAELLAVLIGAGTPHKTSQEIAEDLLKKFQSFKGLANQPLEELTEIRGLKDVKATRIAAAFEIAKRIVEEIRKGD